jgi:hypothetical protein
LRTLGCRYAQGFLLGRPLLSEHVAALLAEAPVGVEPGAQGGANGAGRDRAAVPAAPVRPGGLFQPDRLELNRPSVPCAP